VYYSVSSWGSIDSAIGLVTSPSLLSPVWTDQGKVVQSDAVGFTDANTDTTAYNCIDPSILIASNGSIWMSFGSYSSGILVTQLDPATGKRLNTNSLTAYQVANNASGGGWGSTIEGSFLHEHGGYYYLFVNYGGCCAGIGSTYNIRVGRSVSVTGPYLDKSGQNMRSSGGTMLLESTGRYIGPGHPGIFVENGTNWFTYHYYDANNNGIATLGLNQLFWGPDGWPTLTNDWSALYTFDTDAREHRAQFNGSLQGSAVTVAEPGRGRVLQLNGTTSYVSLPHALANSSTFAAWVKWNGGGDWQRIFDFGTDTTRYFFLTPRAYNAGMRFAITTSGGGGEQQINAPSALPTNSWVHVAVTLDGQKGILYSNAVPVVTNTITLRPWQILARSNFIGESQWTADPAFNGKIDSFRVFGRALAANEIRDLAYAHPGLAHRYSFTSNAWDSIGMAHGSLKGTAAVTNGALELTGATGSYVDLPGGLVSGSSAVSLEFWASFRGNGNWSRVFDFGNISGVSGQNYFFFSPHTSGGAHRLETSAGTLRTFDVNGTYDNRTLHVVCVVDPTSNFGAIYTNGVLEASISTTWPAFASVSTAWSFIGRSLFSSDAWLNASIDELRIYDGRLTPEEIAVNYRYGPDALALPVTLVESNLPNQVELSWPAWAVGFTAESSTNLANEGWNAVTPAPSLQNDLWSVSVPKTNVTKVFRLNR